MTIEICKRHLLTQFSNYDYQLAILIPRTGSADDTAFSGRMIVLWGTHSGTHSILWSMLLRLLVLFITSKLHSGPDNDIFTRQDGGFTYMLCNSSRRTRLRRFMRFIQRLHCPSISFSSKPFCIPQFCRLPLRSLPEGSSDVAGCISCLRGQ
jgi:hypothetical protein